MLALAIPIVVTLILTLFIWPALGAAAWVWTSPSSAHRPRSRTLRRHWTALNPGPFEVTARPDANAARQAVPDRDVVDALVPGEPVTALTASTGRRYVAQLVQGLPGPYRRRRRPWSKTCLPSRPATRAAWSFPAAACSR